MSVHQSDVTLTPHDIFARKGGLPIVCLTAYTTPIAQTLDPMCDLLLVGDSVGMVMHGLDSTLGVTIDMMIMHGRAVRRGTRHAVLVVDMPFGTYERSRERAYDNAARLIAETGGSAVKLEGGGHMADTIHFLVERGIPVMGHVGLTPQSVNVLGGYKVQGRGASAEVITRDALLVSDAGAFSIVLEKIPAILADEITNTIPAPTIGIGASANCDGQILVTDDMVGMFTDFKPKFVKRYANIRADISAAVGKYRDEVQTRAFPEEGHTFS